MFLLKEAKLPLTYFQFYVFTMVPPETEVRQFNLRYSCSQNVYERFIENIDGEWNHEYP